MATMQFRSKPFAAATSAFRAGTITPRDFLEDCLAAIAAREDEVHAFAALNLAGARHQADLASARWREGRPLSPIDGMPIGIKDVIETADMPTGMGSPLFEGTMTGRDAASVFALREAGAVIVGKTVTCEFAATEPGPTRNPHDLRRTPGGSSSGSAAAVGAGMLSAGLGTQVIGSIVRPASYCGCHGFKPTVGAINRGGSHDFNSQSAQGVLAASLADCWQVMREIARRAGGDPGCWPFQGPEEPPAARVPARLAFIETAGWAVATPAARQAIEALLDDLAGFGIAIGQRGSDPLVEDIERLIAGALPLSQALNAWESRWPLNLYAARAPEKLSLAMRSRLAMAEAMTPEVYAGNLARRQVVRDAYAQLRGRYDAVVTLAAPDVAPIGIESTGNPVFAVPGSMLGVPALSLPVFAIGGLPLNLQIMGFARDDADLFAVAGAIEGIIDPPV
ncbi:amidase [Novosphingobium sp. H3SJ31-1]|uniref:Amidase n=2 Tax=Novosphingobium album (ex Liu et al. 2023) TaxID=3031130 RepID=A0ABT5WNB7_9SPHN|nr:amidase [Novosphingobium album (ex Liu et al. 2023)]